MEQLELTATEQVDLIGILDRARLHLSYLLGKAGQKEHNELELELSKIEHFIDRLENL